ncbi:MAG: S8 family serine peptidase [Actinomycetota bacterium]
MPAAGLVVSVLPVEAAASRASASARSSIVVVRNDADPEAVARSVAARPRHSYTSALRGFAAGLTGSQRRKLEVDRRVLSVTDDRVTQRQVQQSAAMAVGLSAQLVPFGVRRVGALHSPTAKIDGEDDLIDVDVAVLDSGVSRHPDLHRAGGVDCTSQGGFDDEDGHGTVVAGIIGASDNGLGVVGVAPGARIWAVRVMNAAGKVTDSDYLCGLDWLHRHAAEIEVANLSFGGSGVDSGSCGLTDGVVVDPFHLGICQVVDAGVVVVAPAMNDSVDAGGGTPAAYPEVITVSAFTDTDGTPGGFGPPAGCTDQPSRDDTFADFSNFGAAVDISAPGVCVISTFPDAARSRRRTCGRHGCYARKTGTSFAAPHVAGAAALLMARHPDWTPTQVHQHLVETSEPGPVPGDPDSFPEGVLNVRGY